MKYKYLIFIIFFLTQFGMMPGWSEAMVYYWDRHPDHERIVFEFREKMPDYSARRSAPQMVQVTLPDEVMQHIHMPEALDFSGSDYIQDVQFPEGGIEVLTRSPEFGFIASSIPQENKIVLDIFQDRLGAKWESMMDFQELALEPAPPADEKSPGEAPPVTATEPVYQEDDLYTPVPENGHRVRMQVQRDAPADLGMLTHEPLETEEVYEPRAPSEVEKEIEKAEAEVVHTELEEELPPAVMRRYEEMVMAGRMAMGGAEYGTASDIFEDLKNDPNLPQEYVEEVLYSYAQANFQNNIHDIPGNFLGVLRPFERAVSADPGSDRLPEALMSMGYIHLQVGNEPEALGYFNLMRDRFPENEAVPATYFYMGEHYRDQGRYGEAADEFEQIIQDYPQDDLAKPSAIALARVLDEMNLDEQGRDILEYIENRWPRHYLDDPEFLTVAGNILYRNEDYQAARQRFMQYINLLPDGDQVDFSMARVGDIFMQQGHEDSARDIYEQTARQYSDSEGGLISQMRLADEFGDETIRPRLIYERISNEFPDSPLAPVALLRLARWNLDNGFYDEAMQNVEEFEDRYSHRDIWPRALQTGMDAFESLVADNFPAQNYNPIIDAWEKHDYLSDNKDKLDREALLALASAYWDRGEMAEALRMAEPFLDMERIDEHNIAALSLLLSIALDTRDWDMILDLAEQVDDWDLPEDKEEELQEATERAKLQLKYATALAKQNRGLEDEARPLWRELAVEMDLPDRQRAFALFFMAEHSVAREEYENAYVFAQESLNLFRAQDDPDVSRIKSSLEFLMDATAYTGRHREALAWALEFEGYIDEDDPDWPAFRYRLANMYRVNGEYQRWERILNELSSEYPDDLHGRMAELDLKSQRLDQEVGRFRR